MEANFPDDIVLLNGEDPTKDVGESIFVRTSGFNFIKSIYDPSEKMEHLVRTSTVCVSMLTAECKLRGRYPISDTATKTLYNVVERNRQVAARQYSDKWSDFSPYYRDMGELVSSMMDDNRYIIVYLRGSTNTVFSKMVNRGREYEAEFMTRDHMEALVDYYDPDPYHLGGVGSATIISGVPWRSASRHSIIQV